MMRLFQALLVISGLWLTSCVHEGATIEENPMSLNEIKRAIVLVTGEPRGVSENGYEFKSGFFDKNLQEIPKDKINDVKERYYARTMIIGDRRPYDINVQVFQEIETLEGYEQEGTDDTLAEKLAEKIKKALHEGRDKRNVIDDFQAY